MGEKTMDYKKFYNDEQYLLEEVGPHFRAIGNLAPADFYTLLNWKSPRNKNMHLKRLKAIAGTFKAAVAQIAAELYGAVDQKRRLEILMNKWGFALPTASAILTILFPADFTVFDWRACGEVRVDYKPWNQRSFSDAVWEHYEAFRQAVIDQVPSEPELREKDRFLIGRSIRNEVEKVCAE